MRFADKRIAVARSPSGHRKSERALRAGNVRFASGIRCSMASDERASPDFRASQHRSTDVRVRDHSRRNAGGARGSGRGLAHGARRRESRGALAGMIKSLDAGRQPHVIEAPAEMKGRIFYRDDMTGFNFTRRAGRNQRHRRSAAASRRRDRMRPPSSWNRCRPLPIYLGLPPRTPCRCSISRPSRASGSATR